MNGAAGGVVVASELEALGVRAFATTRLGQGLSSGPYARFNLGDHVGDDAAAVAANRASLVRDIGLPSPPHWLRQVHGQHVHVVDRAAPVLVPEADAAVTRTRGAVLAILTADCLPILVAHRTGTALGAIHAGWRGLACGVIARCVSLLGDPDGLVAWIGPAISAARYEVGADVRDACLAADPGGTAAFSPTRPGHWLCDLAALARRQLGAAGVASCHGGAWCSFDDAQRWYSHRRDGARTGRMASLAWLP